MIQTAFCALCAATVFLVACLPLLEAWEKDKARESDTRHSDY